MGACIGYELTGGQRDFTSVSQVVATQYEVLVEHKFRPAARELLTQMDPMAAAQAEVRAARRARRPLPSRRSSSLPPTPDAQCLPGMRARQAPRVEWEARGQAPQTLAIQASTSADVRGIAADRFSQPSSVTTTSSSMRTPMPRNRSGA